jgi:serine/threonine protein kinase
MTFKKPFVDENHINLARKILGETRQFPVNYSHELRDIGPSMLLKDPFMRPSLRKMQKHPPFLKFSSTKKQKYIEKAESIEKDIRRQRLINQQLEKEIQQFELLKHEIISKKSLF